MSANQGRDTHNADETMLCVIRRLGRWRRSRDTQETHDTHDRQVHKQGLCRCRCNASGLVFASVHGSVSVSISRAGPLERNSQRCPAFAKRSVEEEKLKLHKGKEELGKQTGEGHTAPLGMSSGARFVRANEGPDDS